METNGVALSSLALALLLAGCRQSGSGGGQSPGTLQFLKTSTGAGEGGIVNLRVARTGGSHGVASVLFSTVDGTAVGGADFTAKGGKLVWPDGTSGNRTISIPLTDDADPEPPETFTVVLAGATGAALGGAATATVHIADDDVPLPWRLFLVGRTAVLAPPDGWTPAAAQRRARQASGP